MHVDDLLQFIVALGELLNLPQIQVIIFLLCAFYNNALKDSFCLQCSIVNLCSQRLKWFEHIFVLIVKLTEWGVKTCISITFFSFSGCHLFLFATFVFCLIKDFSINDAILFSLLLCFTVLSCWVFIKLTYTVYSFSSFKADSDLFSCLHPTPLMSDGH